MDLDSHCIPLVRRHCGWGRGEVRGAGQHSAGAVRVGAVDGLVAYALYLLWSMGRTFWTDYRRHQEKRGSNLGGWGPHLPIEPMPRTPSKPRVEIGKNGRGCLYPQPVTDRRRQRHWKDWLPHALTAATLTVWTIRDALAVWVFVVTSKMSPTLAD